MKKADTNKRKATSFNESHVETALTQNTRALKHHATQVEKQNSLMQSLLRGLFTSLGATIGLAIVLGFLTVLFAYLAKTPFIGNLVQSLQILIEKR